MACTSDCCGTVGASLPSKLNGPIEGPGFESAEKLARIHNQLDMLESALAPVLGDQRLNPELEKTAATPSPVIQGLDSINDRLASILGRIHI